MFRSGFAVDERSNAACYVAKEYNFTHNFNPNPNQLPKQNEKREFFLLFLVVVWLVPIYNDRGRKNEKKKK